MIKNVNDILEVDLLGVIQKHMDLEQKGVNWKGCCPFHNEKTASFVVSPSKGLAKCFGCGWSTTQPVKFLMEHPDLQMSYPEALEAVAKLGNVIVEYEANREKVDEWKKEQKATNEKRVSLLAVMKQVGEFFGQNSPLPKPLPEWKGENKEQLGFFVWDRWYSQEIIERFGLCIAPQKNELKKWAKSIGAKVEFLKELGLVKNKYGRDYDTFRNRLMFPIHDHKRNLVAYGGKKAKDQEKAPKYINSDESAIYSKSHVLYGLHQNKRGIKEADFAFLVEGYTDVITLSLYGFHNAVASCGTAFTKAQAKLLKHFTKNVTVLFDGDQAGVKSAAKAVEILIEAGLNVSVLIFKDEEIKNEAGEVVDTVMHDPDSFLRRFGKKAFRGFCEGKISGIEWLSTKDLNPEDQFSVQAHINVAAHLISWVNDPVIRADWVGVLCEKGIFGPRQKILKEAIVREMEKRVKKPVAVSENGLPIEMEKSLKLFGVCEKEGAYFAQDKNNLVKLTNFIFNPLFQVMGQNGSMRMVEIRGERGEFEIMELDAKSCISFETNKVEIFNLGNYRYSRFAKSVDFTAIIDKISPEFTKAYRINRLGLHRKGFWVWGGGIQIGKEYQNSDERGLVEYEGTKFILPGRNLVQEANENIEQEINTKEYIANYKYHKGECISFTDWTRHFLDVHGENGLMGIAWWLTSLFRDVVQEVRGHFPILWLFGLPQTGKSSMAWSLSSMSGKAREPIDFGSFTRNAYVIRVQQMVNGFTWIDEYSNDAEPWKIKLIKPMWEGLSRTRTDMATYKEIETNRLHTGILISSQYFPTADKGIPSRIICLEFGYKYTKEAEQKFEELKEIELSGQLAKIMANIIPLRETIKDEFSRTLTEIKARLRELIGENKNVTDRILNNHTYPLVIAKILSQKLKFADFWKTKGTGATCMAYYDALEAFTVRLIEKHASRVSAQSEEGDWWDTIQFLIEKEKKLKVDMDFRVDFRDRLTVVDFDKPKVKGKNQNSEVIFEGKKKVLLLRFVTAYKTYAERQRKEGASAYGKPTMLEYLRKSPAYLGDVAAYKFNKKAKSCYAFDMGALPFDLPTTYELLNESTDNDDFDKALEEQKKMEEEKEKEADQIFEK